MRKDSSDKSKQNSNSKSNGSKGYSLLEILIVLILVSLGIIAVAVNIPASRATIEPESVLAQTASFVLEAKRGSAQNVMLEIKKKEKQFPDYNHR